jgi:hypothetical protein
MRAPSLVQRPGTWLVPAVLSMSVSGCGVRPLGDGSDPKGSSGAVTSAATGVNCGADPETGVQLCLGTRECPDVKLDADAFPGCGFHTTSKSYDLECVCNASDLCPIGVASSCDDIAGLFAHKTIADICNQAGGAACRSVARAGSGAPSGPPSNTSPNCNQGCAADCEGSPPCLQACGC